MLIHWIVIYLVNSAIPLLNNQSQVKKNLSNNHSDYNLVEIINGQMTLRTSPQTKHIRRKEEKAGCGQATSDCQRIKLAQRMILEVRILNSPNWDQY